MNARIDLTGKRFGRWTVLSFAGRRQRHSLWLCRCECGGEHLVDGFNLKRGSSTGCVKHPVAKTHGMAGTPEWNAWRNAEFRCTNPNYTFWADYGGRGIKFLFTSFEQFFAELGPRPAGKSLDRIENDGHYEPGNVRWATPKEQIANRRPRKKAA